MVELADIGRKYLRLASDQIRHLAGMFCAREERPLREFAHLQAAGEHIEEDLLRARNAFRRRAGLCAALFGVLFVLALVLGLRPASLEDMLKRPAYGEGDALAEVELQLDSRGRHYKRLLTLTVPEQELTEAAAEALFDRCEPQLRYSLQEKDGTPLLVSGDLSLPKSLVKGLVSVSWESEDALRLDEEGRIDLVGLEKPLPLGLRATLSAGDFARSVDCTVILMPDSPVGSSLSLQREAERLLASIPDEALNDRLVLPARSAFGADASWQAAKEAPPWEIASLGGFCLLAMLFSRTDAIRKKLKRQQAALEWDIPDLSLQLELYLNAGLSVDAAFERAIMENRDSGRPLYAALETLRQQSKEMNAPFAASFFAFAQASGLRDLIRLSSLVLDCSGKGSELAGKLDRERLQLESGRLNAAKAKARTAETKLCFPLMGMLLVMVVIAIAPALMDI